MGILLIVILAIVGTVMMCNANFFGIFPILIALLIVLIELRTPKKSNNDTQVQINVGPVQYKGRTKKCAYCKNQMPHNASVCPSCGKYQLSVGGAVVIALLVVVFLLFGIPLAKSIF